MRKESNRFRVLIVVLSTLMTFCLVCPPNDGFGEIRFLSPNLALGNSEVADQDDLVSDSPAQSEGIVSNSSVNLSRLGIHPYQDSLPLPFQPFSFEPGISILRC